MLTTHWDRKVRRLFGGPRGRLQNIRDAAARIQFNTLVATELLRRSRRLLRQSSRAANHWRRCLWLAESRSEREIVAIAHAQLQLAEATATRSSVLVAEIEDGVERLAPLVRDAVALLRLERAEVRRKGGDPTGLSLPSHHTERLRAVAHLGPERSGEFLSAAHAVGFVAYLCAEAAPQGQRSWLRRSGAMG